MAFVMKQRQKKIHVGPHIFFHGFEKPFLQIESQNLLRVVVEDCAHPFPQHVLVDDVCLELLLGAYLMLASLIKDHPNCFTRF